MVTTLIREGRHNWNVIRAEDLPLTERHIEILGMFAEGMTQNDIARRLWLSLNTVKSHTVNLRAKLRAKNTVEAVAIAIRRCLI